MDLQQHQSAGSATASGADVNNRLNELLDCLAVVGPDKVSEVVSRLQDTMDGNSYSDALSNLVHLLRDKQEGHGDEYEHHVGQLLGQLGGAAGGASSGPPPGIGGGAIGGPGQQAQKHRGQNTFSTYPPSSHRGSRSTDMTMSNRPSQHGHGGKNPPGGIGYQHNQIGMGMMGGQQGGGGGSNNYSDNSAPARGNATAGNHQAVQGQGSGNKEQGGETQLELLHSLSALLSQKLGPGGSTNSAAVGQHAEDTGVTLVIIFMEAIIINNYNCTIREGIWVDGENSRSHLHNRMDDHGGNGRGLYQQHQVQGTGSSSYNNPRSGSGGQIQPYRGGSEDRRGNGGRRSYHGPSDSGGYPGQIVNAGEQHQTGHHGMDRRMMEINAATQYDQAPDEIRRELYLLLLEVVHRAMHTEAAVVEDPAHREGGINDIED
eukprot:g12578.t1